MKPLQNLVAILLLACSSSADHGIKTARHAYSASSSGSNAFANAGSFAGGNAFAGASNNQNPAAFWWAGPDSPFKLAHEYFKRCSLNGDCGNLPGPFPGIPANIPNNLPSNGCNDNGCSFSGGFNVNDKSHPEKVGDFGPIDISKNPFLNGEFKGVAISSCSGHGCPDGKPQTQITTTECKGSDCKTNTQHGTPGQIGFGNNPFLGGSFAGAGAGAGAGTGVGVGAGAGSFGGSDGSGCAFGCGQVPAQKPGGCTSSGCSGNSNFQSSYGSTGFTTSGCTGVKGGCNGGTSGQLGGSTSTTNNFAGSGSFSGSTIGTGSYPGQSGHLGGQSIGQPDQQVHQNVQPGQHNTPGQPGNHAQLDHYGQPNQLKQHNQPGQQGQGIPTTYPGQVVPDDFAKSGQPIPTSYPGQSGSTIGSQTHSNAGSFTGSFGTTGTKGHSSGSHFGQTTTGQFGNTYEQQPDPTIQPGQTPSGTYNKPSGFQQPASGAAQCYGQGLICVEKYLCVNGFVNKEGDGLLNVRHGEKYCDASKEVCCQLPGTSGAQHKDINLQLPNQSGGQSFFTTSSHTNSAASAAASSASTSSSGSTYFTSNLPNTDAVPRFSTPGPASTPQLTFNPAPGVYQPQQPVKNTYPAPTNQYQPLNKQNQPEYNPNHSGNIPNQPGNNQRLPENNQFQPGPGFQPGSNYQPGQTINFGGKDGTSPGVIQVVPDGQTGTRTQAPDLVRPSQSPSFGPGAATQPGLSQVLPNGQVSTSNRASSTYQPNFSQGSTNGNDYKDVHNELNFASTIQGPAYLPPGPSPSPSPSNFSPDLLPPNRPTYPQQTSTTRQEYRPTTPKPVYSSSPSPTTYYPTTNFQQPSTSGYVPPYSGSQTQTGFISTRKPQTTNGYLPPNQVPSASGGDNSYLPPPKDREPDSNIINISVLRPNPDRDPAPTNPDKTFIRPTPRPTEFGQNTTPYPGCAAALKCVTEDYCTAEGVISPVQVVLTKEQQTNRVPLTECLDPETGIIGKCCRDPEYKDPWPSTQLGLFNPDQDNAGSNNNPNRQRPNNNGQYRPPGTKGGRRPYEPNQIGSPSNNPNAVIRPGGYPTHVPNIPFDSRQVNVPVPVDVKPPIETDYSQKVLSRTKIAGETCGNRHSNTNPQGPGPIDANFAEIPWQAMILRDTNRSLLCGGAIIRKDVVLTAAHCVENLQANDVLVKGGEWKLGIDEEPKPFQINKVATIVRHPGYNPQTRLNDIALLILDEKFRTDRNVDTLCLPDPDEDVAKTFQKAKCITTGWGKTILQLNIVNSIMHILGVGIMQGSQCQQQLQQYHSDSAYLYNTNCVCGAPVQPQTDICDVDVGSALACDRGDGRYTLAGVYSWDTGCNPTAQIAGYTKVDTHWIESTLQRPIKDLRTEERGFYAQLQAQGSAQECHCLPGK